MMTKKDFIALADRIKHYNKECLEAGDNIVDMFDVAHLELLADFCQEQNPQFNRERWLGYIAGTCGKSGGRVKVNG